MGGAVYNSCWKTTYAGESSGSGLMLLLSGGVKLKVGSESVGLLLVKEKEVGKEVLGGRHAAARPCM